MKKFVFIISVLVISVYLFGYSEEEQSTTIIPEVDTETPPPKMEMIPSNLMPSGPLEIRNYQTALKRSGDYKGRLDDKWGHLSEEAVWSFQKRKGLKEDGIIGPKTWALLSKYIQDIQIALKNAGYYTGPIDGNIGRQTMKAIKDFQKANNLEVDGKVGDKTWDVLKQYLNP